MDNSFEDLGLKESIIKGVYLYGYTVPSTIQISGIKVINQSKDCIIQSQSGTGKTSTYLLSILNKIECTKFCQGIVVTPTRELATQVYNVAKCLSTFINYKIIKCIGGTNVNDNINDLYNTNLIIGTLGRIHHIINNTKYNIKNVKFIVLDEVDELVIHGINDELKYILKSIPKTAQKILISATMSINVFNLSKEYLINPNTILLKNNEIMVDLITQFYIDVETEDHKLEILLDLYNLVSTSQAIIFCNTIEKVILLEKYLLENNFPITSLHSNITVDNRVKVLDDFRNGVTRLLLTTDLLARGIDIPQVNMVINYDLPYSKEIYVHRIGRCGRFDKKGIAISIVKNSDVSDMKNINKLINIYKINIVEMPENLDKFL